MNQKRKQVEESNAVLQGKLDDLRASNERLQEKIAGYAHKLSFVEADSRHVQPLKAENKQLRSELFTMATKLRQFEKMGETFKEQRVLNDLLKATIVQQLSTIEQFRRQTQANAQTISDLTAKIDYLQRELDSKEKEQRDFDYKIRQHEKIRQTMEKTHEAKLQSLNDKYANIKEVTISLEVCSPLIWHTHTQCLSLSLSLSLSLFLVPYARLIPTPIGPRLHITCSITLCNYNNVLAN
eukprot:TRINITY_DN3005_c0_g1_i2.p1 TRINITY_DN3005_c0_g1~~TRINITY_DN3005_c0_g1_i2.p1  ORF type:complete len:239 (+),score=33.62 TRINITY_DN3005_c0_g1_i2:656-1372(+)